MDDFTLPLLILLFCGVGGGAGWVGTAAPASFCSGIQFAAARPTTASSYPKTNASYQQHLHQPRIPLVCERQTAVVQLWRRWRTQRSTAPSPPLLLMVDPSSCDALVCYSPSLFSTYFISRRRGTSVFAWRGWLAWHRSRALLCRVWAVYIYVCGWV